MDQELRIILRNLQMKGISALELTAHLNNDDLFELFNACHSEITKRDYQNCQKGIDYLKDEEPIWLVSVTEFNNTPIYMEAAISELRGFELLYLFLMMHGIPNEISNQLMLINQLAPSEQLLKYRDFFAGRGPLYQEFGWIFRIERVNLDPNWT